MYQLLSSNIKKLQHYSALSSRFFSSIISYYVQQIKICVHLKTTCQNFKSCFQSFYHLVQEFASQTICFDLCGQSIERNLSEINWERQITQHQNVLQDQSKVIRLYSCNWRFYRISKRKIVLTMTTENCTKGAKAQHGTFFRFATVLFVPSKCISL